ncbi:MAG: HPF/RaiA family ribosome-associated protein [Bacteroidaceae bacterium]
MEIKIQSIHFDSSALLNAFIEKKTSKLEKIHEDIQKVEVSLKVVKPEVSMNKYAAIKVLVPHGEFFADKASNSFEESVDICIDAITKQLAKHKEKSRNK